MNIYSLLDRSCISANLQVSDKKDLINELVDLLEPNVDEKQLEQIRSSVFEREAIMSTGVGKHLAIPHGKCSTLDDIHTSLALLAEPIDFDSIDNQPVKIAFLLVCPENKCSSHIKLLSRISRVMNSKTFREKLVQCKTADEIYETFQQEEIDHFGG